MIKHKIIEGEDLSHITGMAFLFLIYSGICVMLIQWIGIITSSIIFLIGLGFTLRWVNKTEPRKFKKVEHTLE